MIKANKVETGSVYNSYKGERIFVDHNKYVEMLRKFAQDERKKRSPLMDEDKWPSFSDYTDVELKKLAYGLVEDLRLLGVSIKGVLAHSYKIGTIVEPQFIVYLPKEYRGETMMMEEMFPQEISTKNGYKKVSVIYRIYQFRRETPSFRARI